ncbi:MAG: MoaD/ThiS family protein [bacterium]|nr:MoaD/ThiS family protein [bacterium]
MGLEGRARRVFRITINVTSPDPCAHLGGLTIDQARKKLVESLHRGISSQAVACLNESYVEDDTVLKEGDRLAFYAPVEGQWNQWLLFTGNLVNRYFRK